MASQNFEPIHFTDIKDKIDSKSPLLGALFLFFMFFFTLLFIYILYMCTRRQTDVVIINASPPGTTGLDPITISGLPMISYGSSSGKKPSQEAECAICLSLFLEGDVVKVLPLCRHGFHSDCVDKWLKTRSSCPLCRACIHRRDSEIP